MPSLDVTIAKHELARLLEEHADQAKNITALQTRMTEMQEAQLARRVRAFHLKFGHPIRNTPTVPSETEVRFRFKLISEEFLELTLAMFDIDEDMKARLEGVFSFIANSMEGTGSPCAPVRVDMVELADAMEDLDYVVEGTRAVFGVHGAPLAAEVQRSNMAKDPNGPDGKPVKPADWTPPQIERELRHQGWQP